MQQSKASIFNRFKVKPKEKWCTSCCKTLLKTQGTDDSVNEYFEQNDNPELKGLQKEETIDSLNSSLTEVGCPCLKSTYAKQKLENHREIEIVLDTEVPIHKTKLEKAVKEKAADMDLQVDNIKNNLHLTTKIKTNSVTDYPGTT